MAPEGAAADVAPASKPKVKKAAKPQLVDASTDSSSAAAAAVASKSADASGSDNAALTSQLQHVMAQLQLAHAKIDALAQQQQQAPQPSPPAASAARLAPAPAAAVSSPSRSLSKSASTASLASPEASAGGPAAVTSPKSPTVTANPAFVNALAVRQQRAIDDLQHRLRQTEIKLQTATGTLQQWEMEKATKERIAEIQQISANWTATANARSPAGSGRSIARGRADPPKEQPLLAHLDAAKANAAEVQAQAAHPPSSETEELRRMRQEIDRLKRKNKELERQAVAGGAAANDEGVGAAADPAGAASYRSGGRLVTGSTKTTPRAPSSLEPHPPLAASGSRASLQVAGQTVSNDRLHAVEAELATARHNNEGLTVQIRNLAAANAKLRHELAAASAHAGAPALAGRAEQLEQQLAARTAEVQLLQEQLQHAKVISTVRGGKGQDAFGSDDAAASSRKGRTAELQRTVQLQQQSMDEMRAQIEEQAALIEELQQQQPLYQEHDGVSGDENGADDDGEGTEF